MAVADLMQVLAGLPGGQPADWSTDELAEAIPALIAFESQVAALRLEALAAFDSKGGAQDARYRSTADWLSKTCGVAHGGAMVHTARALRDELPATAKALASGCIGEEHVRIIRRAHRMFGDDFAAIEEHVVSVASRRSAKELRRFVDLIVQQYRPEHSDDDAEVAQSKRKAFLSRSLDGWWHLNGLLDPATGEKLKAAFDVFADRASEDDDRTPGMRRNDALGEIASRALAGIDRASGHGHVLVHLTPDQLETGLGVAWPSGSLLTRQQVGEHTCAADAALVVMDPVRWEPLQVGFTARYATRAQRVALQARDGDTCVHPGCSTQASRCIAHHIVHWSSGGPTDVENLVLLCEFHHRKVHHGRLEIATGEGRYTTASRRPQFA